MMWSPPSATFADRVPVSTGASLNGVTATVVVTEDDPPAPSLIVQVTVRVALVGSSLVEEKTMLRKTVCNEAAVCHRRDAQRVRRRIVRAPAPDTANMSPATKPPLMTIVAE